MKRFSFVCACAAWSECQGICGGGHKRGPEHRDWNVAQTLHVKDQTYVCFL